MCITPGIIVAQYKTIAMEYPAQILTIMSHCTLFEGVVTISDNHKLEIYCIANI